MDEHALLGTLSSLRSRLRDANRERGRTSLTLHLTRLERDKARGQAKALQSEAQQAHDDARALMYRLRELMEVTHPGMVHGSLDDDYKATIAEIRRLRSLGIVAELERERDVSAMQGLDDTQQIGTVAPSPGPRVGP